MTYAQWLKKCEFFPLIFKVRQNIKFQGQTKINIKLIEKICTWKERRPMDHIARPKYTACWFRYNKYNKTINLNAHYSFMKTS